MTETAFFQPVACSLSTHHYSWPFSEGLKTMEVNAPALIAFTSAILVGFTSHFVVEDYRRFRDGQAIAAALTGELRSITSSISELQAGLIGMKELLDNGHPLPFPEFPIQSSPMFEAIAEKIGLLGIELAGDVAFFYGQIKAFQASFHWLSKHNEKMPMAWSYALVERLLALVEENKEGVRTLIRKLSVQSNRSYLLSRPVCTTAMAVFTFTALSSLLGAAYFALSGTH
jgi:hypothetical protein